MLEYSILQAVERFNSRSKDKIERQYHFPRHTCSMCKLHFNFINSTAARYYHEMCTYLVYLFGGGFSERDCLWEIDWIIGVGCSERWLFWSAICILFFSMKTPHSKESILLLLLFVFEKIINRVIVRFS